MNITAADALMGIFGFKRVADDEITLDNPPPLDDDSGSLNEGMKMSEVKNEGLEVVATLTVSFDEGDGGSAIEQVETHTLLDEGAHDLCRHSEALAGYAVRDARIAELELSAKRIYSEMLEANNSFARMFQAGAIKLTEERDQLRAELAEWSPVMQNLGDDNQQLRAKLDASKFCADVADDLRAELADAKETISRYEVTAENCDVLRAELANQLEVKAFWIGRTRALEVELAAIKAQVPVAWEVYYSDDDSFHTITRDKVLIECYSKMAYTIKPLYADPVAKQDNEDLKRAWQAGHDTAWYGKNPAHERGSVPVAKQVVMPEALDRAFITGESCDGVYRVVIQSETLKEMQSVHNWIVRLNAADHSEYVRAMVPDGWLVEKMADNGVSGFIVRTPRAEGVRTCTAVFPDDDDPAHRLLAMLLASPPAKGGE